MGNTYSVVSHTQLVDRYNPRANNHDTSKSAYKKGIELYKQGKFNAASNSFKRMFQSETLNPEDFKTVGFLLSRDANNNLQQDRLAMQCLEQVLELVPDDAETEERLADLYSLGADKYPISKEKLQKAETCYLKAINHNPENQILTKKLANLYSISNFPAPQRALEFGLLLAQSKDNQELGVTVITNRLYRQEFHAASHYACYTLERQTGYKQLSEESKLEAVKLLVSRIDQWQSHKNEGLALAVMNRDSPLKDITDDYFQKIGTTAAQVEKRYNMAHNSLTTFRNRFN